MMGWMSALLALGACAGVDDSRAVPHGPPPQTYVCDGGKEFVLSQFLQDDVQRVSFGTRSYTLFARKDEVNAYGRGRVVLHLEEKTRLSGLRGGDWTNCDLKQSVE